MHSKSLTVRFEDAREETITVRTLRNSDWIRWIDAGFDKSLLVFRSVDRAEKDAHANQAWFDDLTRESAAEVVEAALALNATDEPTKKIMAAANTMLKSFLSLMQSSSSSAAATPPRK